MRQFRAHEELAVPALVTVAAMAALGTDFQSQVHAARGDVHGHAAADIQPHCIRKPGDHKAAALAVPDFDLGVHGDAGHLRHSLIIRGLRFEIFVRNLGFLVLHAILLEQAINLRVIRAHHGGREIGGSARLFSRREVEPVHLANQHHDRHEHGVEALGERCVALTVLHVSLSLLSYSGFTFVNPGQTYL